MFLKIDFFNILLDLIEQNLENFLELLRFLMKNFNKQLKYLLENLFFLLNKLIT